MLAEPLSLLNMSAGGSNKTTNSCVSPCASAHAQEALQLSRQQEATEQLKHQGKIKVCV